MNVKISINAIEHYFGLILGFWIAEHDVPAKFLEEYNENIFEMQKHIKLDNDEKYVQLALAYLIESENDLQKEWEYIAYCSTYPFDHNEFKEIVEYTYSVLWPNTPPKEVLKGYEVEFIKTGDLLSAWLSTRDELNPTFNKSM